MTTFDTAYLAIQKLVQKFENNYSHYMSASYSESEARQDFIDDFFIALGWDVTHRTQTNPYEQEVKIERSQKQQNESARKRADYAFFLAPNHKDEVFFVEAKKPSVLIQNQPQHYFQTLRYGWNAGCPISILTDFEEFVIIDCRSKPDIKYALNGKHKSFRYTDYIDIEKFKEIYWVFSREAVGAGSIKKYAELLPKAKGKVIQKALFKGGYQAIDDSFLEYIDAIRLNLAQAFKKNDESLDGEQLTEAVQRTVDRLVFIRFLEDKFIEADSHVNEWAGWKDFISDCRKLDAKYNGVVFKKHFIDEQDFTGAEDALFKDICQDISSYNSPFDFNYIPIHILGSIYERFLGKVIRTTAKRVFVEEKPEVRKAGGVYYTPKYIVDYIVQNTVGKQIEGKTPKQIADLHFADIACGSGSFLIGVYDCLLDYHKKYYVEKLIGKTELDKRNEDYENVEYKNNQWLLTLKLKQDIILNNIYGVDIDYQAVEVTQLSLFLKMLEDESLSSIGIRQGRMFAKVLPDLTKNIVCGNSLIGYDIMQLNGGLFEDAELKKLNPMDYNAAFPKVMRSGGFDGIVGNPPWSSKMPNEYVYYISNKYKIDGKNVNLFAPFVIRGYKDLLNRKGISALLIPKVFIKNTSYTSIRKDIIDNFSLVELTDFGKFPGVASDCIVSFIKKDKQLTTTAKKYLETELIEETEFEQSLISKSSIYAFSTSTNKKTTTIIETILKNSIPLLELGKIKRGIELGQKALLSECTNCLSWNEAGEKYYANKQKVCKKCKSVINKDAKKTIISHRNKWDGFVIPCVSGRDISKNLVQDYYYIRKNLKGIDYKNEIFEGNRIYLKRISPKPECVFLNENEMCFAFNTVYSIYQCKIETLYILGILNSKAMNFFYEKSYNLGMNLTTQITIEYLKTLPIPKINFDNQQQKSQHDKIVNCVTQLITSKQKLAQAKEGRDKNYINNQCNALDTQIDNLVYALYGLTDAEIKIVEGE